MAAPRGGSADREVGDEHVVDQEVLSVAVHSSPRYGRFLGIGVFVGLAAAITLTFLSSLSASPGGPLSTGAGGVLRVFAVYAAVCVGFGLLVMGLLAIVLGRATAKRVRSARAEHDTTLVVDLEAPVNDDVPRWVRDSEDLR